MTAEILPSGMAMTGNPILVKVTAFGEKYVQVSVKHANKEVFQHLESRILMVILNFV